ncbi:hypothetical protein U728_3781 (plasmid) [Clostridium botulinum 202F]|nr:hypothetical protein U728_3781 [Clostridium botulinum 202F]KAI3344474.1 hypothetical protein CIT17_17015 [Clostridium botulinum]KON13521.1 hypothetical protein ACP50_05480 [Clostridium botulinum]NFH01496.1 hypothetical protein [Clostridium botulinum]NFP40953.1 hypothetical protein [Clostridium botulinum]
MEAIKLSNYFQLINPTYTYIQIVPHRSIRNYNSSNIAKAISHTYKSINKRVHKEQKKIFIETNFKISYIIDIEKNNANFYFLVPVIYKSIILEKISEIWSKATIKEVEDIPTFSVNSTTYSLNYKKDDALSLNVNKTNNEPLNSILNVMDIMQDTDRLRIAYNFMPIRQIGWKERYEEMENKVKNNKPLEKKITSFEYILKAILGTVLTTLDCILEVLQDFTGGNTNKDNESLYKNVMSIIGQQNDTSKNTKKKKEATIINTQIAVISDSIDKTRQENNALSICQSYNVLSEDNELIYKKVKKTINIEDYDYKIDINMCSSDECQNFIQIPADHLLKDFKINHIETTETPIPVELLEGTMCIGSNICKGKSSKAYLSTDKDFRNLTLCAIAPTRSGKTTLLKHLVKDSIDNNECSIIFDFCGECEFSNDVSYAIDKKKILNIDCSNFDELQGLGFNEIFADSNNTFEVYKSAKMQTAQLVNFINSINIDNELEPRMNRYLKASSLVVFISNGSIKDVFNVLEDYKIRRQFIDKIQSTQRSNLEEYVLALQELDDWCKTKEPQVVGTKVSYIQGILNRLDVIKSNVYMELMLKKDCSNNINLVQEMQKNQLICLKMKETMFSTDEEKDVYCTYWINKIWGALQQRHSILKEEDRVKVNLFFDELYQVPCCQTFLKIKLNQIAKKTAKSIISCHSLEQIKYIRPELKSANTSYMLIAGCNKDNYLELKQELEPFELDDLLNLKRYYSLNLIKCNDGYAKFITKLPH